MSVIRLLKKLYIKLVNVRNLVIGITIKGKIFPLGAKAGTSRDEINREWKEKQIKLLDVSILICDGEPGLSKAFSGYASEQQR